MVGSFWRHLLAALNDCDEGLKSSRIFLMVADRDGFISARRPENWRSKGLGQFQIEQPM